MQLYAGAVVPGVAEKEVPHKADCLHLCHSSPDCTAAIFNYRTKLCRVVVADPDAQPESEPDWVVIQICPQQQTSGEQPPLQFSVVQLGALYYTYPGVRLA